VATAGALLVSKKPGGSYDISRPKEKEKEKEKRNLSFAHENAMACVPVSGIVFENSRGEGERRREEGRG
jgi:hypothetical protein